MIRKKIAAGALVVAGIVGTAVPAFAHECYRTFNGNAGSQVARSTAWGTADDWTALAEQYGCEDPSVLDEALAQAGDEARFMFPGLLAGGAERLGKAPSQFGYLPVEDIIAACAGE